MAYIQALNGYIFTKMNCVTMDPKKWIYSMVLKINLDKKTEIWLDSWFIQVYTGWTTGFTVFTRLIEG